MDVEVQLADGRWDRAEVLAEGIDPGHGWRILLRWGGGYQAWFIPDPAKIRPGTGPPGSAGLPVPARVLEPAPGAIAVCGRALPAALTLSGAPMGNVQLVGPATGALRIVAQQGFGPGFLDYFSAVEGEASACGQAFQAARPVWVNDVSATPSSRALRPCAWCSAREPARWPLFRYWTREDMCGPSFPCTAAIPPSGQRSSGASCRILRSPRAAGWMRRGAGLPGHPRTTRTGRPPDPGWIHGVDVSHRGMQNRAGAEVSVSGYWRVSGCEPRRRRVLRGQLGSLPAGGGRQHRQLQCDPRGIGGRLLPPVRPSFVNRTIYRIARSASYHKAFHDITAGNNLTLGPVSYQYHAGPGWDPVTGWGSPSAAVLVPLLARS